MLWWRATLFISPRFVGQEAVRQFHICEASRLLHVWMLQLCNAANCQELQKMLKKKIQTSHRNTGPSEILLLFSPFMLSFEEQTLQET